MNGQELLRMGFTRVNFTYFLNDADIKYILDAIEFICEYGWMFLPHYKFDLDLGYWINREESEQTTRAWLGEIDYSEGFMKYTSTRDENSKSKMPYFIGDNIVGPLD